MRILSRPSWILAAALGLGLATSAQQQQPPPPPKPAEQAKPARKPKKVWTEDDIAGVRKPQDEYLDQKAAEEAAAKATAQKPGEEASEQKPLIDPVSGKPYVDPDSPEGLEAQLKRWEASVSSTEQQINEARARLAQTSDQERWETAKMELDTLEQNLVDTRRRIEELKVRIAAVKPPAKDAAPKPPQ